MLLPTDAAGHSETWLHCGVLPHGPADSDFSTEKNPFMHDSAAVEFTRSNPKVCFSNPYSYSIIIIIISRLVYTVLCVKDYEDGIIPEGLDPDIVRTEKQLDFEEAWAFCKRCLSCWDMTAFPPVLPFREIRNFCGNLLILFEQFPGRPSKPGKGCPCAMLELLQHDSPRAQLVKVLSYDFHFL